MKHDRTLSCRACLIAAAAVLGLAACGDGQESQDQETTQESRTGPAAVDTQRIINADREPGNWMSYGRTYSEQRFSPLTQINDENAAELGLAWYVDLDTSRGQEATPVIVDGVMYTTTAWSMVKALDAATGEILWEYDPAVPRAWGVNACCDVVNRGVAVWQGKVYVGTLDGRLVALDAETGKPVWSKRTTDMSKPYTITGAPRVIDGKVLIGNGGAEFGVRGYISAYDAETGEMAWRFYTVPGNPEDGFDNPVHEMTIETWNGEWWTLGGGGTVWDSMAYDPELDLLYIGVGNGSPWNQEERSPGGGDNLFLSSIVALDPDTGEYVWHYQTTPGESWDYTATQHMILADIEIDGETRKVIMQAPKNGFFYVIDRETGELLSAEEYAPVNWAEGIDMETGRPIVNPAAEYYQTEMPWMAQPGPMGAHNWQPMAFNPNTGLVYIPVNVAGFTYAEEEGFQPEPRGFNTGIDMAAAAMPVAPEIRAAIIESVTGHLAAWDPATQEEVWRVQYPGPWNGGLLSTAGNLVVQGTAAGELAVYRADNGDKLWSHDVQSAIIAPPVTYTVDGEQYIAAMVGWGGIFPMATGEIAHKSGNIRNISRIITFKLDGQQELPEAPPAPERTLDPPEMTADAATVERGRSLYHRFCGTCHGDTAVSGGVVSDLRYSSTLQSDVWFDVVLEGLLSQNGMASFDPALNREDAEAIRAYVIKRAHDALMARTEESGASQ